MQFLKSEIVPLANVLKGYSFGHIPCETAEEFTGMQTLLKKNMLIINKHLQGKTNMVGDHLTIVDIYLCLSQIEMQQCVMDPNNKNSLNNFNKLFLAVA